MKRVFLLCLSGTEDNNGSVMSSLPQTTPGVDKDSREPQLFRFHLRHLLLGVTLFCIFCAMLVLTDGPWPLVITSAVLLVGAHVMGTAIGTRLRNTSGDVSRWLVSQPEGHLERPRVTGRSVEEVRDVLPPSSPLATKQPVARWTRWFIVAGISLGLIGGAVAIGLSIGGRISWAGWLVGTISCGILGAWVAFLGSTFGAIARHAWKDADRRSR